MSGWRSSESRPARPARLTPRLRPNWGDFTGIIIGYPFGVTTVINPLCMSVLLVLVAQCTYAGLSAGEYALTVKPGFMGIDGLPNSYMTPVPSSTYASSCPGW